MSAPAGARVGLIENTPEIDRSAVDTRRPWYRYQLHLQSPCVIGPQRFPTGLSDGTGCLTALFPLPPRRTEGRDSRLTRKN